MCSVIIKHIYGNAKCFKIDNLALKRNMTNKVYEKSKPTQINFYEIRKKLIVS